MAHFSFNVKKVLRKKWKAVSFWVEIYNFVDVNINVVIKYSVILETNTSK